MQRGSNSPIGLFDSGVGGLTVFREISRLLPNEDLIYLGDTARLPYGNKSSTAILQYAKECASFLLENGVKLIIIACHTASCHALEALKKSLPIPVIGMIDSGIELIQASNSKNIALLATQSTIASNIYQNTLLKLTPSTQVHAVACPLFAPLVEEALYHHEIAKQISAYYLDPLKSKSIEAALLACTHYPLLHKEIQEALGPSVKILEPTHRCAQNVQNFLLEMNLTRQSTKKPSHRFFTTDHPKRFSALAKIFLNCPIRSSDIKLTTLTSTGFCKHA
jgi:glutamate racemase